MKPSDWWFFLGLLAFAMAHPLVACIVGTVAIAVTYSLYKDGK